MGRNKKRNNSSNKDAVKMQELDPKTGGDYVDFDVEDPEEEKPVNTGTEIKTTDKPLSENGKALAFDNHSRSSSKNK